MRSIDAYIMIYGDLFYSITTNNNFHISDMPRVNTYVLAKSMEEEILFSSDDLK